MNDDVSLFGKDTGYGIYAEIEGLDAKFCNDV